MLSPINNISVISKYRTLDTQNKNVQRPVSLPIQKADTVSFTGKSAPSMYSSVFEYLASEILGRNQKYQVNGSMLSASKITDAVKNVFDENKVYTQFKKTIVEKIKWKSYIPQDIREGSVAKINEARAERLAKWQSFLENPVNSDITENPYNPELVAKIKKNESLKLVIWDAINSEIKDNNRHIPVPFNDVALLETIKGFEKISPKDRAVRCASPSFIEIYTHRLRDNLLMKIGLSNKDSVWVKVPSIKHDPHNKERNISMLETLSCKNWCTRSSVDKARDALLDGDFYIYLERGKSKLWEPLVGMASSNGKLDQIQGVENNNIVPLHLVEKIKNYIQKNKIKCHQGLIDEGPKAGLAIKISEKLNEVHPILNKTFSKAIKENDAFAIFKFLGVDVKYTPEGYLSIENYKPSYTFNTNGEISVPYSMFGFNEDELMKNVKEIKGNLILHSRNDLYTSRLSKFPENLESVKGRIVCTEAQFEKYKDDIIRVKNGDMSKVIIHRNK